MTRIRKNWSSSQSAEDPESVRSGGVITLDSQMKNEDGRCTSNSPNLSELVNEFENAYNLNLLANVAQNSSPKAVLELSVKRVSVEEIDQPCIQGEGLMNQHRNSSWFPNLSRGPFRLWLEGIASAADGEPIAISNSSTKREVDEVYSKSSSITATSGEAQYVQNPAADKPTEGFVSQLMQTHSDIRQKLWETQLNPSQWGELASRGQGADPERCCKTNVHKWQCSVRAEKGFSLCKHHLKKLEQKVLRERVYRKLRKAKASTTPQLSTPPPDLPGDSGSVRAFQHASIMLRRRYKTAKLSML